MVDAVSLTDRLVQQNMQKRAQLEQSIMQGVATPTQPVSVNENTSLAGTSMLVNAFGIPEERKAMEQQQARLDEEQAYNRLTAQNAVDYKAEQDGINNTRLRDILTENQHQNKFTNKLAETTANQQTTLFNQNQKAYQEKETSKQVTTDISNQLTSEIQKTQAGIRDGSNPLGKTQQHFIEDIPKYVEIAAQQDPNLNREVFAKQLETSIVAQYELDKPNQEKLNTFTAAATQQATRDKEDAKVKLDKGVKPVDPLLSTINSVTFEGSGKSGISYAINNLDEFDSEEKSELKDSVEGLINQYSEDHPEFKSHPEYQRIVAAAIANTDFPSSGFFADQSNARKWWTSAKNQPLYKNLEDMTLLVEKNVDILNDNSKLQEKYNNDIRMIDDNLSKSTTKELSRLRLMTGKLK